jgi:iron complex transport system substrate-binding protein
MRIVSLLPAATEIVCALGAREELVGISHECDFPPGLCAPVLTRARDLGATSAAIDKNVRDALSIYEVDAEKLAAARPDVVITQDLCAVCAVSLDEVSAALREIARSDARLVCLSPLTLDDVMADVERIGAAIGRNSAHVIGPLRDRIDAIAARASRRARVLTIEWLAPVMIGGLWMPELIELAGGQALVTNRGEHAPTLSYEQLARLEPDVVLIKPCGFGLERTLSERETIRSALPPWPARTYVSDGNAFFNRPGPRLVESLEILAACIDPERFADLAAKHDRDIVRLA